MYCDARPDVLLREPQLRVSVGQHSDRGRKALNQDFYGFRVPPEPQLSAKGIAIAVADGIGSSDVSQVAAEFAVMAFLDDYYSTSETWSVKKSADRVLAAANSWLHSRTYHSSYRYEKDRGELDDAARAIVAEAYRHGSADNLTVQIVAVEAPPEPGGDGLRQQVARLAPPPSFEPRAEIDGYRIAREIHASARSRICLAV